MIFLKKIPLTFFYGHSIIKELIGGYGGIGRRARFRFWWCNNRVCSSHIIRTKIKGLHGVMLPVRLFVLLLHCRKFILKRQLLIHFFLDFLKFT